MTRILIVLTLLSGLLAQSAPQTPAATGLGLIVGRVVDGVTGRAIAGARVRLTRQNEPPRATALTGAGGHFVFSSLQPGTYDIRAYRAGYLEGGYGRLRPEGSLLRLELGEGERRGEVDILVWPTASLSGRVFDDSSSPLAGAAVFATRVQPGGPMDGGPTDTTLTDSTGAWRLDGLAPGRYVVSVRNHVLSAPIGEVEDPVAIGTSPAWSAAEGSSVTHVGGDGRFTVMPGPVRDAAPAPASVFMSTWFSGVLRASEATPIDLAAGADHLGVDVTMRASRAVRVRGRVFGLDPAVHAAVRLLPADTDLRLAPDAVQAIATAHVGADGLFVMPAVAPGAYVAQVAGLWQTPRTSVSPTGVPRLANTGAVGFRTVWANAQVVVEDAPENNMTVVVPDPVTLRGTVTFETPPPDEASSMQLILTSGTARTVRVDGNWRFAVDDVRPGWMSISATRLPRDWTVLSVLLGGQDVAGMSFAVERDMPDAVVRVGPTPIITGQALDEGRPADDATVLLFPADPRYWNDPPDRSSRFQTLRTNSGEFSFSGMPAGEYYVTAVTDDAAAGWPSAPFIRRLSVSAARVIAASGVQRVVAVPLDRTVR